MSTGPIGSLGRDALEDALHVLAHLYMEEMSSDEIELTNRSLSEAKDAGELRIRRDEGRLYLSLEKADHPAEGWYTAYASAYLIRKALWTDGNGNWWQMKDEAERTGPVLRTRDLSDIERIVQS